MSDTDDEQPPQPTLLPLHPAHQVALQRLLLLIEHHKGLLAALEGEVEALLTTSYGLDMAHETWDIDLRAGLLRRVDAPQP